MNSYTMQMIAQQRLEESARRAGSTRTARYSTRVRRPRRVQWSLPAVFVAREAR